MDCEGVRDACLVSVISISSFRCWLHGCVPLVEIHQDVRAFSVCGSVMKRFCFQAHLMSFHRVNICVEVTSQDTEHGHPRRSPSRSLPNSVPQKQGQFWLLARRQRPHLCPVYLWNTLAHYRHWQVRVELIYYKQKLGSQKKLGSHTWYLKPLSMTQVYQRINWGDRRKEGNTVLWRMSIFRNGKKRYLRVDWKINPYFHFINLIYQFLATLLIEMSSVWLTNY